MKEALVVYGLKCNTPLVNHINIVVTNYPGSIHSISSAEDYKIYDVELIGRKVCQQGATLIQSLEGQRCCRLLRKADEIVFAEFEGDFKEIERQSNQKAREVEFSYVTENCADMLNWFLETFTDIPASSACSKPHTCDHVCCCIWWPKFFSCCCTTPDAVIKSMAYHAEKESERVSKNK